MLSQNTVSKGGFCCNLLVEWKDGEKSNSVGPLQRAVMDYFPLHLIHSFKPPEQKIVNLLHFPQEKTCQVFFFLILWYKTNEGKGKGKVHPRRRHKDPEGEYKYSSTLSLNSALDGEEG